MPNLSIKNVPAPVVNALRERAARNHRSLQGELMAIVCALAAPVDAARARASAGTKTIEQIAAEHRARWPEPFDRAPTAVDVVRADRDAR